jgi:3-methyladenine DNA glycosylase AlkD
MTAGDFAIDGSSAVTDRRYNSPMSRTLLLHLRSQLKRAADPRKAPDMQKYMKSAMPYHGVPGPVARQVFKNVFADLDFPEADSWRDTVLYIWRNARFREERYAAIALCESNKVKTFQTPETLPVYEEMIVTGAWWDVVDWVASHCVGLLLRRYPKPVAREMLRWSRSEDMWKRRASIICQLGFKENTDLKLLYACIEPSLGSKEFFLRKAIGWALRQYAWTNPAEVRRYVRAHEHELSPLSKREALKNI